MADRRIIIFRGDANEAVGIGHIFRLLAICEILMAQWVCKFVVRRTSHGLINLIREVCDQVIVIEREMTVLQEAQHLITEVLQLDDIVVLDGYEFGSDYQQLLRKNGNKVVFIDDLASSPMVADVVINHAGILPQDQYQLYAYTWLRIGTRYLMVRSEFIKEATVQRKIKTPQSLVIAFGATDIDHLYIAAMNAVAGLRWLKQVHIVISSEHNISTTFKQCLKKLKQTIPVEVHQRLNARNMVALMKQCDVAIAASSTLSMELCCVGIGLISVEHATNQSNIGNFLRNSGCAAVIKYDGDICSSIKKTVEHLNTDAINEQLRCQEKYFCDSRPSLIQVFDVLSNELNYLVRHVSKQDMNLLYGWANDPSVREHAVNTEHIAFDDHVKWFNGKLKDIGTYMYVLELSGISVGQARFEWNELKNAYEVDYSIDRQYRGRGIGKALLRMCLCKLCDDLKASPAIFARVHENNMPSFNIFEYNSFLKKGTEVIDGRKFYLFVK